MTKIGDRLAAFGTIAALVVSVAVPFAFAGEVKFTAEVSESQISADESVSLNLIVVTDGDSRVDDVNFEAPDFDVVNERTSSYSSSYWNNGKFGMNVRQTLTKVLRPRKAGSLLISGIRARAEGKIFKAPDIRVQVTAAGAGTPPPRSYGGRGVGLRGAAKQSQSRDYLVRAEIDKDHAFKGEQVIVSYYLYRRASVFNIQVDKFPELKGFLREELEMPVMGARLDSERVTLDGVPYARSLLARYAAYPLQEGKLRIDPIALKFSVQRMGQGVTDDEDPMQIFRALMPTAYSTQSQSEALTVDVQPLPADGRPVSFTGGVGDFNISSAVNKYELHANEAVTLTVKIEGQGNVSAIGEPKVKWPDGIELYDSKGTAKTAKGGLGEKVFEFVVIPRVPGKVTLPPLEFSFYNPSRKTYITKQTEKTELNVLEPVAGSPAAMAKNFSQSSTGSASAVQQDDIRYLKAPGSSVWDGSIWNWIYGVAIAGSFGVILWIVGDSIRRKALAAQSSSVSSQARVKLNPKAWEQLKSTAKRAVMEGLSGGELSQAYEQLSAQVLEAIDQATGIGAKSLPRAELSRILGQDHGCDGATCEKLVQLLEFAETVRYASALGAVSEQAARTRLDGFVRDGEAIVRALARS